MPYYCTVPQCTSMAGRAKNVSFHQFPRDESLAEQWNVILKRNKPYTKYSKVCSRHFTSTDYTMTHMGKNKGQWKTLNKDAMPSQNLPRLNPDGSLMVLRKNRSPKHRPEDANASYGSNSSEEGADPASLVSLAKEYLAATTGREAWYDTDTVEEDDQEDPEVMIKQEYPVKRTVQMQDATIQTDLCQPSLGLRRSHDTSGFFPQHILDDGGSISSISNYFQPSSTEPLSLPKEPLTLPEGGLLPGGSVRPDFRRIFLDQLDQTRKKRPLPED